MEDQLPQYLDTSNASVAVLLAVITGLVVWFVMRKRSTHRNLPPGPPSIPILGSLPFMGVRDRNLHIKLNQMAKHYGSVFHFWIGKKLAVVLDNYQVIREALVDNAVAMSGRPQEKLPRINPNLKGIMNPTYSLKWKHDRNLFLAILKGLGFGKTLMEDRILEEVDAMLSHLNTLIHLDLDPAHVMQVSVANVICSIALGRHFKYDDRQFLDMIDVQDNYVEAHMDTFNTRFVPILRLLPSKRAAMDRQANFHDQMLDFLMEFIRDHKKCHVRGDNSDFIHAYLDQAEDSEDDESLLFLLRDLFLAGTETTSASLRWAFVYMANNPDVQKRIQAELDSVLLEGRLPSLQDKVNLPYTEAATQELLRLAAVAPQIIPHEAMEDVTVHGYFIPKGALILGNLWAVSRDPTLWPEPDKFRPERFLSKDGQVLHRPELIPFSLGRRSCPGEIMAKQEIFLVFAAILHNYSIHKPEGVDLVDETGRILFTRVPNDYRIVIRRRR